MKFLVLNGSARKASHSITMKITNAFLDGYKEVASKDNVEVEVIEMHEKKIEPCRSDFSCWFKTPGTCIIQDDVRSIYDAIDEADFVIWSMPLYVFGVPGVIKTFLDRSMIHRLHRR